MFWFFVFVAGLCAAIGLVVGTIAEFASAATSSSMSLVRLQGSPVWLPSVTICHSVPVRCRCSGFYLTENPPASKYYGGSAACTAFSSEPACKKWQRFIAPYMCNDAMVYRECGDYEDCSCRANSSDAKACHHPDFNVAIDSEKTRNAGKEYQSIMVFDISFRFSDIAHCFHQFFLSNLRCFLGRWRSWQRKQVFLLT